MDSRLSFLISQRSQITQGPCASLSLYEVCEVVEEFFKSKTNYCSIYEKPKIIDDNVEYYDDFSDEIEIATDHNSMKIHILNSERFEKIFNSLFGFQSNFKYYDLQKIFFNKQDQTFTLAQGCSIKVVSEFVVKGAFNKRLLLIDTRNLNDTNHSIYNEKLKQKFFIVTVNNIDELQRISIIKGDKSKNIKMRMIIHNKIGIIRVVDTQNIYLISDPGLVRSLTTDISDFKYLKMLEESCYDGIDHILEMMKTTLTVD